MEELLGNISFLQQLQKIFVFSPRGSTSAIRNTLNYDYRAVLGRSYARPLIGCKMRMKHLENSTRSLLTIRGIFFFFPSFVKRFENKT